MSDKACLAVGGELKDGNCLHTGEIDMEKICDADDVEFSTELNACILGKVTMRKICAEKIWNIRKNIKAALRDD